VRILIGQALRVRPMVTSGDRRINRAANPKSPT
jgi:hypothetical protein